jgi:prepilin-type N-terminal cleavage/methylation domain-containing protein
MRGDGFSLVEVMCAMLVLGFGMVGLTQGLTVALASSKESERQTHGALIAAGRLEWLQAEGFLLSGEESGDAGPGLPEYRWLQTTRDTEIEGLYDVEVAVEHGDPGRLVFVLRTLLFEPPLVTGQGDNELQSSTEATR